MQFNRFDVSAKELVWDDPDSWLERFGIGAKRTGRGDRLGYHDLDRFRG